MLFTNKRLQTSNYILFHSLTPNSKPANRVLQNTILIDLLKVCNLIDAFCHSILIVHHLLIHLQLKLIISRIIVDTQLSCIIMKALRKYLQTFLCNLSSLIEL